MQAAVGDQLHIHSRSVGMVDQKGEIIEVRGQEGEPPYMVRFEDGHVGLIYPGPDCNIERREALH
ncbi:DUF1918 domain-containing protein [Kitasatospora sp. CM 4170]|uniref:DUF1918 domain-containing protein n=1 Tax=Kitasatospora aburaviensis TaxID=67265 RepID=A0ABW1F6N6_9ACTN|nr:DUF1918 domain-containing protein [Kitasatospora sp. CM 4170]WNM49051.1 DUF1918 domain-containing protein [Kitasatospora sp. CM 4170]